jgi:S1-C subfamily serine protease
VILSFAGREIEDENHLINIVAQTPIGDPVPFSVWRNRTRVQLRASLAEWAGN